MTTAVVATVVGLLFGPILAGLQLSAPGPDPMFAAGWWRGGKASSRRILWSGLAAAVVLGTLAAGIDVTGAHPAFPAFAVVGLLGVVLAPVDVAHHRLPDRLVLPAYPLCVALLGVAAAVDGEVGPWLRALAAGAVVFAGGFVLALLSPSGLGFGDVKLAGLLALVLGYLSWAAALLAVLLGFALGGVAALGLLLLRRVRLSTALPLGPALLLGAWAVVTLAPLIATDGGGFHSWFAG